MGTPINISSIPYSGEEESFLNNSQTENLFQMQPDINLIQFQGVMSPKFGSKIEEVFKPQPGKSRNQVQQFQTFNPQANNFEIDNLIIATIDRIKNERLRR